ncbi:hypothetical protein JQC67_18850 [Aurantibacter crassamenti]|uniref:hypothetical protein n=1 Tax=Aurantibacter crassamenti TaxID=1837375 RepID=UPI00193941FE|nr:hypothetical protein [Aurantibacter crassamenti]MBM1108219.1 hypothetical protein [Aurantibacter crassamenti]
MSTVATCPTCGSSSKIKETNGVTTYQTIQEDDLIKKVGQLKKAMQKYKEKAERLEKQLKQV